MYCIPSCAYRSDLFILLWCLLFLLFKNLRYLGHQTVGIRSMNSKDGMSMEEMRKLIEK